MTAPLTLQTSYLQKINTGFLLLLAAHVPVLCGVALYFGTGITLAAVLGLLFLAGPAVLYVSQRGSKLTSVALAIASMCFSALLIHLSGGMIEMHFHLFTMLALMIAFRFPWPLVAAGATIAVHHVAFFFWLPHSIFSYQASLGIVALHAFFVIFLVVPALWLTKLLNESALSSEMAQEKIAAMADSVRSAIRDISAGLQVLDVTSLGLATSSGDSNLNSRHAAERAQLLTVAAERMSSTSIVVASGMEQTSGKLAAIAASTEDLSATIGQIAGNSEKARRIADEASLRASQVTAQMKQLSDSVQQIGKITETITEISSQTNLLALNATIEAARAGAAGKGFSVVASEIKALASQTAAATEDIKSRISALQMSTAGGIREIEGISQVVVEMRGIVSTITGSIGEQDSSTRNIARHISEAASDVKDANRKVSQTSQVSSEITKDIAGVNQISSEMALNSERLLMNSGEISKVADQLKVSISSFESFFNSFFSAAAETTGS